MKTGESLRLTIKMEVENWSENLSELKAYGSESFQWTPIKLKRNTNFYAPTAIRL
jgi:hypothetical protein